MFEDQEQQAQPEHSAEKGAKYRNLNTGVYMIKNRLKTEIESFHTPLKALYDENFDLSFGLAELKRKVNLQTDIDLEMIRQDYKQLESQEAQHNLVQGSTHRQHSQQIEEVREEHQDLQSQINQLN